MKASSKEIKIWSLIVIDTIFFFVELGFGYYAHSLALIADAFHMLNDVVSLFVGLWAVRVATKRVSDSKYTYGWARAELIGGLVNGVFLMALCMTITLEAISRIAEPQEVRQPLFVAGVGAFGLASNLIGLAIFGGHAHSHGEEDEHDHDHDHGHDHEHSHGDTQKSPGFFSRIGQWIPGRRSRGNEEVHDHADEHSAAEEGHAHAHDRNRNISWDAKAQNKPATAKKIHRTSTSSKKSRRGSRSYSTIDDIPIHPASLREGILANARGEAEDDDNDEESAIPTERTSLLPAKKNGHSHSHRHSHSHSHGHDYGNGHSHDGLDHSAHNHAQPKKPQSGGGHGHSHADMNMRGMIVHVIGDALGNIGVIAAAGVIYWFPTREYGWSIYADPLISLIITVIILKSAWPLCRETAKPLLQAVPSHVSVEEIGTDIETLPGVERCHHVHVWALTPSKLVATLDVQVDFKPGVETNSDGNEKWMALAKEIKACLHGHGIHSSTIQPEFPSHGSAASSLARRPSGFDGSNEDESACFLDCKDGCKTGKQCCDPPRSKDASGSSSPH